MKLKFYDTIIYFKTYFSYHTLKHSFPQFCEKLKSFPLNKKHPEVMGLYLSGNRDFRKILFHMTGDVFPKDIEDIKSITPIIDKGFLPYVLEQNYFEIHIPTKGNSFDDLMDEIDNYDIYIDELLEQNTGKKIEIHLRGALGKQLSRRIFHEVIPNFAGIYHYHTTMKKDIGEGEIRLPTVFEKLPQDIKRLDEVVYNYYCLKLIQKKNKIILKPVTKLELGISIYSDQCKGFKETLKIFEKGDVFEPPIPLLNSSIPHLAVSLR